MFLQNCFRSPGYPKIFNFVYPVLEISNNNTTMLRKIPSCPFSGAATIFQTVGSRVLSHLQEARAHSASVGQDLYVYHKKLFLTGCWIWHRLVPCLYPIKDIDRLQACHSRDFIGYVVLKIWRHASYQPRSKLNIGKNMAAARPGSGVIHEPRRLDLTLLCAPAASTIGWFRPHKLHFWESTVSCL